MKKNLKYLNKLSFLMLITLLLGVVSCKRQIETKPYSLFDKDNFFKTEDEAYLATLGVYETMKSVGTYAWYVPLVYDADTDIEYLQPGTGNQPWQEVGHYFYSSAQPYFFATWSSFYSGIDRANLVIEKIPQMSVFQNGTAAQKTNLNRMLAEAKFLRGFFYSELVRLWGDVPFKIKSSETGDNLNLPLTDRYVIYTQIIKDMQEAIEALPATIAANERVNKYGAKAVLARVALFAGGYSLRSDGTNQRPSNYSDYYRLAKTLVDEVISSGLYDLNPSYSQVFKNQSQQIFEAKESLFEASVFTPAQTNSNSSYFGYWNAPVTAAGVYAGTVQRVFVTPTFYNTFSANDTRRDFSIARYQLDANGNRLNRVTGTGNRVWAPGKWTREIQKSIVVERAQTNINCVIMRYSDVLLMKAEIENELNGGPTVEAYNAINQVRRRGFGLNVPGNAVNVTVTNGGSGYGSANTFINISGSGADASAVATIGTGTNAGRITAVTMLNAGMGYTSIPSVTVSGTGSGATFNVTLQTKPTSSQVDLPSGLSKDQFLEALRNERAWELCFEGMRRADLIRWNILGDRVAKTFTDLQAFSAGFPFVNNFVKGKHELYPFPQNEKDSNTGITRQNPGF